MSFIHTQSQLLDALYVSTKTIESINNKLSTSMTQAQANFENTQLSNSSTEEKKVTRGLNNIIENLLSLYKKAK